MTKKKGDEIISLENYDRTSSVEDVAVALLRFYLDAEDDELELSPYTTRVSEGNYGMHSTKNKQVRLGVGPLEHIIPFLLQYFEDKSEKSGEHRILHVCYNNQKYAIPVYLWNKTGKEAITLGKPKKLEQKV